jgi:RNA polymerase sigma-70 factor (ECF subfamily)
LSLVDLAARGVDEAWREAWARFLRTYGTPLHTFLVRTGSTGEEASEILQEFLVQGMEGRILDGYDPSRGRLRTWLLACLQNVRRKSARRERARPEAPNRAVPIADQELTDPRAQDPTVLFEAEWNRVLARLTLEAVRDRLKAAGDPSGVVLLDRWVLAEDRPDVQVLADELGITPGTLYTRATRLRQAVLREAEAQARTLANHPADVKHERDAALRHLRLGDQR